MVRASENQSVEPMPHSVGDVDADPLRVPLQVPVQVSDPEVPMFVLLRSTLGLPVNDSRWWPIAAPRRSRWFATSDAVSQTTPEAPHHAVWLLHGEAAALGAGTAPATVELIERTLSALRSWASKPRTVEMPAGRPSLRGAHERGSAISHDALPGCRHCSSRC
jgi:hypothetical protein